MTDFIDPRVLARVQSRGRLHHRWGDPAARHAALLRQALGTEPPVASGRLDGHRRACRAARGGRRAARPLSRPSRRGRIARGGRASAGGRHVLVDEVTRAKSSGWSAASASRSRCRTPRAHFARARGGRGHRRPVRGRAPARRRQARRHRSSSRRRELERHARARPARTWDRRRRGRPARHRAPPRPRHLGAARRRPRRGGPPTASGARAAPCAHARVPGARPRQAALLARPHRGGHGRDRRDPTRVSLDTTDRARRSLTWR